MLTQMNEKVCMVHISDKDIQICDNLANGDKKKKLMQLFVVWMIVNRYILPLIMGFLFLDENGWLYIGMPLAPHFFYYPAYTLHADPQAIDTFLLVLSILNGVGLYAFMFTLIGMFIFYPIGLSLIPSSVATQFKIESENSCGACIGTVLFIVLVTLPGVIWNVLPWEYFGILWYERSQKKKQQK